MEGVYMTMIDEKELINKYVMAAEDRIKSLKRGKDNKFGLTTSQLRKFLSMIVSLKQKVEQEVRKNHSDTLSADLKMEIYFLKVMISYQAGREQGYGHYIQDFIDKTEVIKFIEEIEDDAQKFRIFCKYVEALVAYHKYYGGKDK